MKNIRHKLFWNYISLATVLLLLLLGLIYMTARLDSLTTLQTAVVQYGYLGIFLYAFISGFNVALPLPAVSFAPLLFATGHLEWLVVGLITIGMTLGDGVGVLVGTVGSSVVPSSALKIRKRLQALQQKHTALPVVITMLYASFVPLPNELIVIPMAFLGYHPGLILSAVGVGNLVFNTLAALGIMQVASILVY